MRAAEGKADERCSLFEVSLGAALIACNVATSEKPLFTELSSTVILKDGLWTRFDPKCAVELNSPKAQWPKCAGWFVLKASKVVAGSDMKTDEGPQDVFIVDGKPPLVQAALRMNGPERAENFYGHFVVDRKEPSSDRQVTAMEFWPVPCDVMKPDGDVSPYPGFDKNCRTASAATLGAAAAQPRAADVEPMLLKWVRAENP